MFVTILNGPMTTFSRNAKVKYDLIADYRLQLFSFSYGKITKKKKYKAIRCNYSQIIAINASANLHRIEAQPFHGTIINFNCSKGMFYEGNHI